MNRKSQSHLIGQLYDLTKQWGRNPKWKRKGKSFAYEVDTQTESVEVIVSEESSYIGVKAGWFTLQSATPQLRSCLIEYFMRLTTEEILSYGLDITGTMLLITCHTFIADTEMVLETI
jgi:hypothetical protein